VYLVAGLATLAALDEGGLVANAERTGALLRDALTGLAQRYDIIGDVRGMGLMVAVPTVARIGSLQAPTATDTLVVTPLAAIVKAKDPVSGSPAAAFLHTCTAPVGTALLVNVTTVWLVTEPAGTLTTALRAARSLLTRRPTGLVVTSATATPTCGLADRHLPLWCRGRLAAPTDGYADRALHPRDRELEGAGHTRAGRRLADLDVSRGLGCRVGGDLHSNEAGTQARYRRQDPSQADSVSIWRCTR
jgi:Aminotransferase class-III